MTTTPRFSLKVLTDAARIALRHVEIRPGTIAQQLGVSRDTGRDLLSELATWQIVAPATGGTPCKVLINAEHETAVVNAITAFAGLVPATNPLELFARPGLTSQQRKVLDLVAAGESNPEICQRLYIGDSTLKNHLRRLYAVLGARNRAHAVTKAHEFGLLPNPATSSGKDSQ